MTNISPHHVRVILLTALALCLPWKAATAATPAETFISSNIQTGMTILENKQLTTAERKLQFETFLLGVTDMKRIAFFTLGQYAASTAQADKDAFANGFQDYAVALYQSYFEKYSGQKLSVIRSYERAPGDVIVVTNMIDTHDHSGQPPLEIDFRVRTDSAKPEIVDFSVAGMWLALAERDDFSAVLGKNNGDVTALTAHLHRVASQY
jgi:phospholipid transport system substrate-binding protein